MKFNKLAKTLSMTALTAAMAVAPAINVFAAPEDIIDTTKKASLTIHKYDMTAAQQDGINVDELWYSVYQWVLYYIRLYQITFLKTGQTVLSIR